MPNMLIADDHPQILSILSDYAQMEGFAVTTAEDGEEALACFAARPFDIVLLDVMMPKRDGFDVCRSIRQHSSVPIIMITARGEDFERIMGLDIGADDYIVKPFSPGEVMARVRAILRRMDGPHTGSGGEGCLTVGDLIVDPARYTTTLAGIPIALTKKEFELLWTLASHPGRVFTRDNLLDAIWGLDYYGDTRTVDSHIKRLRAKLGAADHPDWQIDTVWGVGYRFQVAADEA